MVHSDLKQIWAIPPAFQKAKYFSHLQFAVFAIIENVSYAQGATNMHLRGFSEDFGLMTTTFMFVLSIR
jgi:hypothetical protein